MTRLTVDFETRSTLDLNKVGAVKYAMHPSTEIMCMGVGTVPGKPVRVLTRDEVKVPPKYALPADLVVVAHNAPFEYAIWNFILHKRYGWPKMADTMKWDCTMARALMCNLPAALDKLGFALGLKVQKDLEGRRIMHRLCKPIDWAPDGTPIYDESPEKYARLYQYCGVDVLTEMQADAALPEMPLSERAIWMLDLLINLRGIQVDLELARKGAEMAETITLRLNDDLCALTGGAVDKNTRHAATARWVSSRIGEPVPSVDKEAVIAFLSRQDLPADVYDVLRLRQKTNKSSTSKYKAIVAQTREEDGRARGTLQYHGAGTGRWAGRLMQPHNFPWGFKDPAEQETAIAAIKTGDPDTFSLLYGDQAMETLSNALRGAIIAAPGKVLLVADYNAIEARVLFWLVGLFFDKPYIDMANALYPQIGGVEKAKHPKEYDLGKRAVLGCGYGMGAEKFKATVKKQANIDIPLEFAEAAVKTYRTRYPAVPALWKEMESAAKNAVRYPGSIHKAAGGRVLWGMSADRRFLGCRLPSGRHLRYYKPSLKPKKTPWGEMREQIHFWAEESQTRQWIETSTYGGSLTENVIQAIARDLLAYGMQKCEAAGFPCILTVHDELIAEMPALENAEAEAARLEVFMAAMCDLPAWAKGCTVKAEGFVSKRYRK